MVGFLFGHFLCFTCALISNNTHGLCSGYHFGSCVMVIVQSVAPRLATSATGMRMRMCTGCVYVYGFGCEHVYLPHVYVCTVSLFLFFVKKTYNNKCLFACACIYVCVIVPIGLPVPTGSAIPAASAPIRWGVLDAIVKVQQPFEQAARTASTTTASSSSSSSSSSSAAAAATATTSPSPAAAAAASTPPSAWVPISATTPATEADKVGHPITICFVDHFFSTALHSCQPFSVHLLCFVCSGFFGVWL